MEQTLQQVLKENKKLLAENNKLKNKIKDLEVELQHIKRFIGGK